MGMVTVFPTSHALRFFNPLLHLRINDPVLAIKPRDSAKISEKIVRSYFGLF